MKYLINQIDVSVILINYKTPDLCCDSIHSLIEHSSGFSYEIIVIDNNSEDKSEEIICKEFSSSIVFIHNYVNNGTAKAFNQGAKVAKGKYLFYLNTDTLFVNNAIKIMLDYINANHNVAIVGGNLYNSRNEPTHSFRRHYNIKILRKESLFLYLFFKVILKKIMLDNFNYSNRPLKVDYVCAAATLISKDIYLSLGGFDEDIFMYGEEALFALKCWRNGYLSINIPEAKIIHFEGDSFKKDTNNYSEKRFKLCLKGTSIFFEKGYGVKEKNMFFKYFLKGQKKRLIINILLDRKNNANVCRSKIRILKSIIKGEIIL